jgi:hypothetical protein
MGISEHHQPHYSPDDCEMQIYGPNNPGISLISITGRACRRNVGPGVEHHGSTQDDPNALLRRRTAFIAEHGGAVFCREVVSPRLERLNPALAQALDAETARVALAQVSLVQAVEGQYAPAPSPVLS